MTTINDVAFTFRIRVDIVLISCCYMQWGRSRYHLRHNFYTDLCSSPHHCTTQNCKAKSIQSDYLYCFPTVQVDMVTLEPKPPGDDIVAMEVVKQPDILAGKDIRTPAQDPPQPCINQALLDRRDSNTKSPMKRESSNCTSDEGVGNSTFQLLLDPTGDDLQSNGSPDHPFSSNQSISPFVAPSSSQRVCMIEYAKQDFIHQGLADLCHSGPVTETTIGEITALRCILHFQRYRH